MFSTSDTSLEQQAHAQVSFCLKLKVKVQFLRDKDFYTKQNNLHELLVKR